MIGYYVERKRGEASFSTIPPIVNSKFELHCKSLAKEACYSLSILALILPTA
jgi:hypothetical protein